MPKLKTRRAAAKRFRVTGSGKFMRRRAFRNHLLDRKSPSASATWAPWPWLMSATTTG